MSSEAQPVEILLVEDSPGDVNLTIHSLRRARFANNLSVVEDGAQAMAFLRGEPPYESAPRPDLILLDLNLPVMSGREVLAEVKGDPELSTIPVVVLTTSSAEADILSSYQLHANSFVTKPVRFEEFVEAIRSIEDFWLAIVRLPPR
ncbi:response regulator [Rhabdothermincola salaria]|uniref:response regulator n=1 Tax=Rhabdothermincola salaria TaxID=2903142 RepID=UPI001E2F61D2|nr:response regulator [Rhabdothermincola salaria]MCD9624825.1 response regulator [Rhabdothermincola salaria]